MDPSNELIKWRVEGVGDNIYNAKKITREKVLERREAMRKLLIGTQFNNSSNEQLDCMRIEYTPYGYIVEDSIGIETVIRYKRTLEDAATSTRARNSTTNQ